MTNPLTKIREALEMAKRDLFPMGKGKLAMSIYDEALQLLSDLEREREVIDKFLLGEDALYGFWFEEIPAGHNKYWWRKHLRTLGKGDV